MKTRGLLYPLIISLISISASAAEPMTDRQFIERGRYIVATSGCNDCHTPGYMKDGTVPEPLWLTGNQVGFQGPWGTSYPANLRLRAQELTEAQWLERARQPMRPPMPWFNLRDMTDDDVRAIYRYLRAAGPAGAPAPAAAPPGVAVTTPYFDFAPKNLPQAQNAANPAPAQTPAQHAMR
jgi:mono/diheme cytochrome c family protein